MPYREMSRSAPEPERSLASYFKAALLFFLLVDKVDDGGVGGVRACDWLARAPMVAEKRNR
jgi:hypothetical protein